MFSKKGDDVDGRKSTKSVASTTSRSSRLSKQENALLKERVRQEEEIQRGLERYTDQPDLFFAAPEIGVTRASELEEHGPDLHRLNAHDDASGMDLNSICEDEEDELEEKIASKAKRNEQRFNKANQKAYNPESGSARDDWWGPQQVAKRLSKLNGRHTHVHTITSDGEKDIIPEEDYTDVEYVEAPRKSFYANVRKSLAAPMAMQQGDPGGKIVIGRNSEPVILIHPFSMVRCLLDCTTIVVLLANVFIVPIYDFFLVKPELNWIVNFRAFCDLWFILDICLNFRTGVPKSSGPDSDCDMRLSKIRQHYMCLSNFGVDFISTVPFDVIFTVVLWMDFHTIGVLSGVHRRQIAIRMGSILKTLKMFKLLRITRLSATFAAGRRATTQHKPIFRLF